MAKDKGGRDQDREHARKAREQDAREKALDKKIDELNRQKKLDADEKLRRLIDGE